MTTTLPYSEELPWPAALTPFTPNDTVIQADPYAHYAWMREHASLLRTRAGDTDIWCVSRYEDVLAVLRDHRTFSSRLIDPGRFPFLTLMDPPDHGRIRNAVARTFTPKAVALLEDFVRDRAARLYGDYLAAGGGDAVAGFAIPLTLGTIGHVLGMPTDESARLHRWAEDATSYAGRIARRTPGSPTDAEGTRSLLAFVKAGLERAAERAQETVARNLAVLWHQGVLSEGEATHMGAILLIAGHMTTSLLIGNGLILLAREQRLLDRLREEPASIPRFVEEIVRFLPSLHRLARKTTVETTIRGVTLPAGSAIRVLTGSANRDDGKFPNADVFDMDRDTRGHVGFGNGIHSCLGAFLARLEGRIAFETIVGTTGRVERDQARPVVPHTGGTMSSCGPIVVPLRVQPRLGRAA